jgi:hypothetical protein
VTQLATLADGFGPAHHRHQLVVTEITVVDDDIFVQYLIRPAPREVPDSAALHGGDDGVAVDDAKRTHRCVVAFRKTRAGNRVVGVLQIVGLPRGVDRQLRALFNPLAQTPGLAQMLCELVIDVDNGRAVPVSLRCGKVRPSHRRQ